MRTAQLAAALLLLAAPALGQETARRYEGLGTHTLPITTRVAETQAWFDQGLRLTYAFNHGEAIASFRAGARLDPQCAMCYWGEAFAFGPNINAPMDSASAAAAFAAVRQAVARAGNGKPLERALIAALSQRYAERWLPQRAPLDSAYARAMAEVAARFPEHDDVQVLYADALMALSPWNYWTSDHMPRPGTEAMVGTLQRVLARSPEHAGACHYYIHAVEAAYPQRAEACADRLGSLMPGAGHIVHMPAHIYVRVGRYADAVAVNVHASHADDKHAHEFAPNGIYRLGYYPHNPHFLWFAAAMGGQQQVAIDAARETAAKSNRDVMHLPGLALVQHFVATPLFALVRFQQWDAVLKEPLPAELPFLRAIWHWARTQAYAARGDLAAARAEYAQLDLLASDSSLAGEKVWDQAALTTLLGIARGEAASALAMAEQRPDAAIAELQRALALELTLPYEEPPSWPLPVRQALGQVLLAAGRPIEAEAHFRKDLERFPRNVWSERGLAAALRAQGLQAVSEAR